jgi:phosphonate transport system ATP-binding protein
MASVKVADLRKTYGRASVVALDGVSFELKSGEAVAIIGPSGAGKTTLFRVLTRSIPLDGGQVVVDGTDLYSASYLNLTKIRRKIGLIYQQHNLVKELDVLRNVIMGKLGVWSSWQALHALLLKPPDDVIDEVKRVLGRVGLANKINSQVTELSGGEQQRVAIARLLLQDPEIILADEPVASVDVVSAQKIMEIFQDLNRSMGKTLICNLHNIGLARTFFERVLALCNGKVLFDGCPTCLDRKLMSSIYTKESEWLEEAGLDDTTVCIERLAREDGALAQE